MVIHIQSILWAFNETICELFCWVQSINSDWTCIQNEIEYFSRVRIWTKYEISWQQLFPITKCKWMENFIVIMDYFIVDFTICFGIVLSVECLNFVFSIVLQFLGVWHFIIVVDDQVDCAGNLVSKYKLQ